MPLVSIIIPTYNSARTLEQCLLSVKNQDYEDIEIIVVDNNSSDATKEIAKKYTDKVFNKGPERTAQKNYGIEKATGEYLLIIDGDMFIDSWLISECVKLISKDTNNWWVCVPVSDVWGSYWVRCIAFERSLYVWTQMEAPRFLRKDLVEQVWKYPEDIIFFEEFIVPQKIEKLWYNIRIHSENKIYHDYYDFNFIQNLKKRFNYGKTMRAYSENQTEYSDCQLWIGNRLNIFFTNKRFYSKPHLSFGILSLKFMELVSGKLGLIFSKKND